MFETAELGRKISKDDYEHRLLDFRTELLQAQFALQKTDTPVLIIIAGVEGAGKGELLNVLTQWLDVRGVEVQTFDRPSEEALERPEYWRYWMSVPARGRIGLYYGSWYTQAIVDRAHGKLKRAELEVKLQRIARFERMLAEDRALVLKFWCHISKAEQKRRFERLDGKKNTSWQVTKKDWQYHARYDRFAEASEIAIRETDSGHAPWQLIEAADARYRNLTVGTQILAALQRRLAEPKPEKNGSSGPAKAAPTTGPTRVGSILDSVDLNRQASNDTYLAQLEAAQNELAKWSWKASAKKRSTVVVFEGWDAAGKGGAIRRISEAVDARIRRVISIAAPTDEERAHHYLWRFWRHLPRAGNFTIYDRSWYGRVLVERVEGFAREEEWRRSYQEINEFEEALVDRGIIVTKFFLHISKDEQERRFKERSEITYKQHKITDEDWRNRAKWDAYEDAINEMVARTSSTRIPWTLVPGNDKKQARIEVVRTLVKSLKDAL